jgi:thaumarchaeosortase
MIIYSVVMLVIAAKLDIPLVRKVIYAVVGVLGTVFLNVLRIFTIAFYGYEYATSGSQLDAFHNSLGEVLFPIWIVVFLVLILSIEDRIAPRPSVHRRVPATAPSRIKSRKIGAR